jgi:hypothetical protein
MNFFIVAPPYRHNSAGVRVLYELTRLLGARGENAVNVYPGPLSEKDRESGILVYPEIVAGNPCYGSRVVRYLLNVPGKLSGDASYPAGDLVFAYSPAWAKYAQGRVLYVPVIEDFFCPGRGPRSGSAVWVGRGVSLGLHPPDSVCLSSDWPPFREDIARLLQRIEVLYVYDECTALVSEGLRCGCRVVFFTPGGRAFDILTDVVPLEAESKRQLDEFIRICRQTWEGG